jgi:hypothetical protein
MELWNYQGLLRPRIKRALGKIKKEPEINCRV